jgi:hypothetical protein|tara:strand:- start:2417 stop:2701 length:285 start_codon:yes stop_codon:yes gene_type:complete
LKVRQFLSKKKIETSEDVVLQIQLFAYTVAKHYGISLAEAYQMESSMFQQSLAWAIAANEAEEEAQRKADMKSNTDSGDIVEFDYSFIDMEEDF